MPLMTSGVGRSDSVYAKGTATGASVAFTSMAANLPSSPRWTIEGVQYNTLNPGIISIAGTGSVVFEITPASSLTGFSWRANALTGNFPDIRNCTSLSVVDVAVNSLSGPIPDLSGLTALTSLNARTNLLSGNIPSFASNTLLGAFFGYANSFTGVVPGFAVPAACHDFEVNDCPLTQAAVDAILAAFVAAGAAGAYILNIGGIGPATPSAAGLTNKATLVTRGWAVTTN
jgi:hypothetical protein